MKATKHNDTFNEERYYYIRKQMKKNAEMLRKAARKNKVKLQSIPLIIRDDRDDFPPYAA